MSDLHYIDSNQITESYEGYKHEYPKYGKSTTDPTYYEPSATRIANMKKASGVKLEGIYDFYTKDDVSKFNEKNFEKHISSAQFDPRYNSNLLREEVSQIANNYADKVEKLVDSKKKESENKKKRIKETVETQDIIQQKLETKQMDSNNE